MVAVDSRNPLLSRTELEWLVTQAARAPSVHNTQPWRFGWNGASVSLYADPGRGLTVSDPEGRELVVSCGAALFNLRLALRKLAMDCDVHLLPDPLEPRLLARVDLRPGMPASRDERLMFLALGRRHTHRGEYDDRPVSADVLVHVQQAAEREGAELLFVSDPGSRRRVLHLARAAERALTADPRVRDEILDWTPAPASARRDGIPPSAYPAGEYSTDQDELVQRDFDLGREIGQVAPHAGPAGAIAVLATTGDLADDWLRAGQGLEHLLVMAARHDVFASIHSQLIEVPNLRGELRRELPTDGLPQLVLRFGHASDATATPRRPVSEVIDLTR